MIIWSAHANYDMHVKKRVYARNGVQEYLVFLTHDQTVHWFALEEGEYVELTADADGILRSRVFPGLWLHSVAFWANDLARLLAALQQGIATPEHGAFVAELANQPLRPRVIHPQPQHVPDRQNF
jgi:Putative restriction endonuclease